MKSYLSSAPVLLMLLLTVTAGMLIEINLILPDLLAYPL
jgi:photosystem I subunit 9